MLARDKPLPRPRPQALLAWYDRHRRRLPWRALPGETADPYRVWLSEIMLQQTTVAAAAPYFTRFTALWPTVGELAQAPLEDVLGEWAGLGYYARARNLHACAQTIASAHGGRFPDNEAALRELPGIGQYTAGAIAAIAFGRRAAAVDGNAERVIARLFAIGEPMPGAKAAIRAHAIELVPEARPGDFAQALMDLGATICTPKRPACALCPWENACSARASGNAEDYPVKAVKAERPTRRAAAFWAERCDGAALIVRRPPSGLLGGMDGVWTSPLGETIKPGAGVVHAPFAAEWTPAPGEVEHVFTHFRLRLAVFTATGVDAAAPAGARWVGRHDLADVGLPTVMRKAAAHALESLHGPEAGRLVALRRRRAPT